MTTPFLASEQPTPAQARAVARFVETSPCSSTTCILLGLARFYESVEDASPEHAETNTEAATMLRRFAEEFAAHEERRL